MSKDPEYEFYRGWEGGYKEGIRIAFKMLVEGKESQGTEDFPKHLLLLKVPKENVQKLHDELDKKPEYL